MTPHIYAPARRQLIQIWHYTARNWGPAQADRYLEGLDNAARRAAGHPGLHRKIPHPDAQFAGIFFVVYQQHVMFFRRLSGGRIGIISVLHSRQDIPCRLLEAMEETDGTLS